MKATYWYNGALICPRKVGYDIIISKDRWIYRDTERKAKWVSTAYRTITGKTFEQDWKEARGTS